jgi:hypothetical protein
MPFQILYNSHGDEVPELVDILLKPHFARCELPFQFPNLGLEGGQLVMERGSRHFGCAHAQSQRLMVAIEHRTFAQALTSIARPALALSTEKQRERDRCMSEDEEAKRWAFLRFQHTEYFIDHLCDVSREFAGDLQQVLILAVIGQATLRFHAPVGRTPGSSPWVNASQIAEITGIPRETVRRKLLILAKRGWIEQESDAGPWRIVVNSQLASPARRDLADLDRRGIEAAVRFARAIKHLL